MYRRLSLRQRQSEPVTSAELYYWRSVRDAFEYGSIVMKIALNYPCNVGIVVNPLQYTPEYYILEVLLLLYHT